MRILVTQNGEILINQMSHLDSDVGKKLRNRSYTLGNTAKKVPFYTNPRKNTSINNISLIRNKTSFSKSNLSKNFNNYQASQTFSDNLKILKDMDDDNLAEFINEDPKSIKTVKLGTAKITFPKNFAEKYEKNYRSTNGIIETSNNILPKLISNSASKYYNTSSNTELTKTSNPFKENILSFDEIIPFNRVYNMKKKIIKDRLEKDKLRKITETEFRTEYKDLNEIERFNTMLRTPKISTNKSNLIKYLNERKINPMTIQTLYGQNGAKIKRVDKMCKIIFEKEDRDKLFNERIKDKLRSDINSYKNTCKKHIETMSSEIKIFGKSLEKYSHRIDPKEKYREHFNELLMNFWLKKDLERFNKKSTPKPKYLDNFYDIVTVEDEGEKN